MKEEYLEFLVEEKSMAVFLEEFLPIILPEGYILNENCFVRPHNGKQDLQKQIPKIVRAYRNYPLPVKFMVIHDQDSYDCMALKTKLKNLIAENTSNTDYLIRIACRELENWYLGDLDAVEHIYPESKASRQKNKAKFREPDRLNGAEEMQKFSKNFGKVSCAREIAKVISVERNKSESFNQFQHGVIKLIS